jgi:hypothetical protein
MGLKLDMLKQGLLYGNQQDYLQGESLRIEKGLVARYDIQPVHT